MARAHYRDLAFGLQGGATLKIIPSAPITLVEPGTTTPIADTIYSAASGVGTLPNPFTADATGTYEFWLAASRRRVDVLIDGGVDYDDLRVSDVMALSSDDLVDLASVQTLTNKTLSSPTINDPTVTDGTFATPAISGGTIDGATLTNVIGADSVWIDEGDGTRSLYDDADRRVINVGPERITFGSIDWTSGSGPVPYGIIEHVYPIDVNNAPKWRVPGIVTEEVVDDPSEINFRRGGQLTPGGAHVALGDSTAIGFAMWWGYGGGDYRKMAQIAVKNTQAVTSTNHGAGMSLCTVPNSVDSEPRPGLTIGPDRRVLLDDALTSLDNSAWNTGYLTGIEERLSIRGDNAPGMTIKNKATVANGNKVRMRHQFTATNDGWAAGNGGFQIETNVTQASPLKTEVTLSSNTGGAPAVAATLTDAGKFKANLATIDPPAANELTAGSILKGAVVFSVAAGVVTVRADYNVVSVSRSSAGEFVITWDTDFTGGWYMPSVTCRDAVGEIYDFANGALTIRTKDYAGNLADPVYCSVLAAGPQ